jgi:hypothetical protein
MWWWIGGLTFGGWLCCGLGLSSALAQDVVIKPCSIERSVVGQLIPNSPLATQLRSDGADSFFEVKCLGKAKGILRLSIDSNRTKVYNGQVQMRLVNTTSIFGDTNSDFTSNPLTIPFVSSDEQGIGRVTYQLQITAPDRYYLQAARDYSVGIYAELLPVVP